MVQPQNGLEHALAVDEQRLLVRRPANKMVLAQLFRGDNTEPRDRQVTCRVRRITNVAMLNLDVVQPIQARKLAVQQEVATECSVHGALVLLDHEDGSLRHHVAKTCVELEDLPANPTRRT